MQRAGIPERLRVVEIPPERAVNFDESDVIAEVPGSVTWNGALMSFRPAAALKSGATYAVLLASGGVSESGRQMLSAARYTFNVRSPRVAYLYPADNVPQNLWIADPADPTAAYQLTRSPSGIFDYAVSPDGSQIAFSERNTTTGTMDIKILDLDSGGIEQVTNCQDAECKTPTWRPDGQMIAYERIDYNTSLAQVGRASPTRIWLIDLSSKPATTRPMFSDSQILGYGLQWSADGQRVTVFDLNSQGILVYDFREDSTVVIPSKYGNPGELSPDGMRVIYPEVILGENETRSYLQIVDLTSQSITTLSTPDDPVDDDFARWSPDGSYLVIGRRYLDDRFTRGKQLYKINPLDGTIETLVEDPRYGNGFFSFDPGGSALVIQRFPDRVEFNDPNNLGLPEIWVLNLQSKTLLKVADNALLGRWVP
jgi:Tol biopolymer transport system component